MIRTVVIKVQFFGTILCAPLTTVKKCNIFDFVARRASADGLFFIFFETFSITHVIETFYSIFHL